MVFLHLISTTRFNDSILDEGGDYFRLLTEGKYFVVAINPDYVSAFGVVEVPAPPDLDSGNYCEAKMINFLLVGSDFEQLNGLGEELNGITDSFDHGDHLKTSFIQEPQEERWLPVFARLYSKTDLYLSTKYVI